MPLLDHQGPLDESWRDIADDQPVPAGIDARISLVRLKSEGDAVFDRTGRLGVIVPSDAAIEDIAAWSPRLSQIGIRFAGFKDGRPFTLARVLRTRHKFTGDLRSYGHILPDQALFLARCGFTSFDVPDGFDAAAFLRAFAGFSHVYQEPRGQLRSIVSERRLERLGAAARSADAARLVASWMTSEFPGRIALVSSFGAESAVLLHMVAQVDPATPVLFLATGKLFPETIAYRARLAAALGLRAVTDVSPSSVRLADRDPDGALWSRDPDACCLIRKVDPLTAALAPFEAWISGRKSYQGDQRAGLEVVELVDGRFRLNPLADWTSSAVATYLRDHDLPIHPLVEHGYSSIGCAPCTRPTAAHEAPRAGRWPNQAKTECGIHAARSPAATS